MDCIQVLDRENSIEFFVNLQQKSDELFGQIESGEKLNKFHRFEKVPEFLTNLFEEKIKEFEGEWKGTIGVYGRKNGTTVKPSVNPNVIRFVLNIGATEVFRLLGTNFDQNIVLANGWSLVLDPVISSDLIIKVSPNSIRSGYSEDIYKLVQKIKPRQYLRYNIVLDFHISNKSDKSD